MKKLYLDLNEKAHIAKYMNIFYGREEGIYSDFFEGQLTWEIIFEHIDEFINRYNKVMKYDGFDTPQREFYRDWLLYYIFGFEDIEYLDFIKRIGASARTIKENQ